MWAICKKELKGYFYSPIGYLFIALFLLITGLIFYYYNLSSNTSDYVQMLVFLELVFTLTVPVLTMRLLAEERKTKSDQLLLTAPLSIFSIVMGKYLAALMVFTVTLILTFVYPIILLSVGTPDMSVIVAGYIGFYLLGAVFIAIGLFLSSLTVNQVVAFISTFATLFFLYLLNSFISSITIAWMASILKVLSIFSRFDDFNLGIIGLSPIVYYLTFIAIFLFLTVRIIERRRWSET